ncbi:hypothetical protein Dimus_025000 [Dionaea muscipula]
MSKLDLYSCQKIMPSSSKTQSAWSYLLCFILDGSSSTLSPLGSAVVQAEAYHPPNLSSLVKIKNNTWWSSPDLRFYTLDNFKQGTTCRNCNTAHFNGEGISCKQT